MTFSLKNAGSMCTTLTPTALGLGCVEEAFEAATAEISEQTSEAFGSEFGVRPQ